MPKYRVMPCIRPVDPNDNRWWPLTKHATPELTATQARAVALDVAAAAQECLSDINLELADDPLAFDDLDTGTNFDYIGNETEAMCATGRKSDAATKLDTMLDGQTMTVITTGMAILDGRKLVLSTKQLARPLWEMFVELAMIRTNDDPPGVKVGDHVWKDYSDFDITLICDDNNVPIAFISRMFHLVPITPCDDQGDYTPEQVAYLLHHIF